MFGIAVGLAAANATEWAFHKYITHGLGQRKGSFWSFHWFEHHKNVRKFTGRDPDYATPLTKWNGQTKEAAALLGASLAIAPWFPIAPFFVGTMVWSAVDYYRKHKRAHLDPAWAREHLPWHYDHHMGPNQDANWCVTRPWMDHLMGTRERYAHTEAEARAEAKKMRRAVGAAA